MLGFKLICVSKRAPKNRQHYTKTVPELNRILYIIHTLHYDVIKWKHFPRYWSFVRGIHRSPVNSPHKGQWRGALIFILICARINGWVNNREAGDLRRYRTHYDVIVMLWSSIRNVYIITIFFKWSKTLSHHSIGKDIDDVTNYDLQSVFLELNIWVY